MKKEAQNLELNIIGIKTKIIGDIISSGDLRIDGKVEGNISTISKVVIGDQSEVKGNINANNVSISGNVTGNITSKQILTIMGTAKIQGDISTGKIVIENGAQFNGTCSMGAPSINQQKATQDND
jgi:cytoskeletal protein CcmA (bactofilin family)